MARNKNQRVDGAGTSIPNPEGDESFEAEALQLDGEREDSGSGTGEAESEGETGSFPVRLVYPDEDIAVWEHFAASLNKFQAELAHSRDEELKALRITACKAPSPTVPAVHHTPFAGFAVVKGDDFIIRLSNGLYITATKE